MAEAADINTYGGKFEDEKPVQNPKTQQSAAFFNRMSEDTAQMTRTSTKARVSFIPVAAAAPQTIDPANITVNSHWGSGSAQKPVITKIANGIYFILFPASFTDATGYVELVNVIDAHAALRGPTLGTAMVNSIASNGIGVNIYDAANTLADLTADTVIVRAE